MAADTPGSADRTVIYLARHGQTPLNESDALRGLADPPLDEAGRGQARRLGAALGPRGLSAVIASPLLRARQTAQPVAELARLEVAIDQYLVDRDYGPWTGLSRDAVTSQWGSVDRAPGVEQRAAVADRAVKGLNSIARRWLGGAVAVVSHDAVNRQVLMAFDARLGDPETIPQGNGCFNTLEWRGDGWDVLSINELPGQPADQQPGQRAGVMSLLAEGLTLREKRRLKAAAARFEQAVTAVPSLMEGWFWLAVTRDNRGQEADAICAYRQALRLGIEDRNRRAQAWTWLASSLSKTGQHPEALDALAEAVKIGGYEPAREFGQLRAAIGRRAMRAERLAGQDRSRFRRGGSG